MTPVDAVFVGVFFISGILMSKLKAKIEDKGCAPFPDALTC
jgi:hypothetical protein